MTTSALPLLLALPHAIPQTIDQADGEPFGMKKAMALMAIAALAILVVAWYVGKARSRRKPPAPPVYPILDPPSGRTTPTRPGTSGRATGTTDRRP